MSNMDADTKPIMDAMANTEFPKGMKRFFAGYVIELLAELYSDTALEFAPPDSKLLNIGNYSDSTDKREMMKAQVFARKVLGHEKIKNILCQTLDMLKRRQDEIAKLFLEKTSILSCSRDSAEITFFHDKACICFLAELEKAKQLIRAGNYRKFWDTLGM